jgi:hypothetical protein
MKEQGKDDDVNSEMEARFIAEREDWKNKIANLSHRMRDIKGIASVQVDLYSERQILIEYQHNLGQVLGRILSKQKKHRKASLKKYSENNDIKYGANEKTVLIEGDLSDIAQRIEMIENHRKYVDQTVQTVDHMLYGIKNRIELEKYLNGSI